MNNKVKALIAIVVVAIAGVVVVQQQSGGDVTLTLATVNNGQMKDMESLKSEFEADNPGIKVNFQVMEEGDLRSAVTSDVANKAGQYDIVTIGAYEVPQWGANGWLTDLSSDLADEGFMMLAIFCLQ